MDSIHFLIWIGMIFRIISKCVCADPKFDPTTKMRLVLVPADASVGSVIYRLRATDEEFDYPLQFELLGDSASSTVQIDSLNCTKYNSVCQANVVLTRRLEPGRFYDFQVSVKDTKGGMEIQSCSLTATNFSTPHDLIFPHKPGIIMIPEDAKRGTELDYVISRKNPLVPKPVYLELWGSPLFAIRQKIVSDETTEGTIFLLGPLDFETQSMYHLTVLANDAYAEPGQDSRNIAGLEVIIIVEDVQDVPPIFTIAPPVTRLPSGLLPGDKILQVHAEDGDKGNPREIRYGLVSEGNPFTSFFDINDTTGEIFLVQPLDEISAITHIGDPVLLTIIAEEVKVTRDEPPAMASTIQLAFFLPERSNSPPYFENDQYISRINENAPQGTALQFNDPYVTRVYDDDTGKNGVFSLTLLGNNGTFEITPNVAERRASFLIHVRDNHMLDYEMRHSVEFQILAQELGPATNLSAIVNVTVFLNDVNDNTPVFDEEMYVVDLPENATAGTKVVQVHATDIDTGSGGRVKYTQILGYLNTSLHLDPSSGNIMVSTSNHGFDRETMPEYRLYVEARDDDGTGNAIQVPLILKMIDVNDNPPIFEKSVYEFILSANLRNFTSAAYVKAIDKDAEEPNNIVRYEIINGNYENKFYLDRVTGHLMLIEPIILRQQQQQQNLRRKRRQLVSSEIRDSDVFMLTVRAYDLGVPVLFSTSIVRIYPPETRTRAVTFVVPGQNPNRDKIEETLTLLTGGRIIIHDIKPYASDGLDGGQDDRSVVTATVLYDSNSVVDISQIQQRLSRMNGTMGFAFQDNADTVYKAENRVLFWLLIFLAILIALLILTLLLCCICSWCPLYAAARKRVVRVNSTEDDVHLVHRELQTGKQTNKSVQVAEWMGRREAWSAEKSSDSRTKPTHWEFSKRVNNNQNLENPTRRIDEDSIEYEKRIKSADDKQSVRVRNNLKEIHTTKLTEDQHHLHNSRTNLINDRENIYVEDVYDEHQENLKKRKHQQILANRRKNQERQQQKIEEHQQQIDDESMRRHEIDRGSDLEYNVDAGGAGDDTDEINRHQHQHHHHHHYDDNNNNINNKRQIIIEDGNNNNNNRDQLFIKEGNAEILRLITRGKPDADESIYVNLPPQLPNPPPPLVPPPPPSLIHQNPQYIMVENAGKEILMKRYIEEQSNGKHIIREHYQVVPGTKYIHESVPQPNEIPSQVHLQYPQHFQQNQLHPNQLNEYYVNKSQPGSIIYSQIDPNSEIKLIHANHLQNSAMPIVDHSGAGGGGGGGIDGGGSVIMPPNTIPDQNQLIIQHELENSLKQQNALLRQILLEKEKLQEKYSQQEVALETQSLPGHSMAIATQTDCDAGTQTDDLHTVKTNALLSRRAKSENDDSMSENDYEYVRYSPPNSPNGVYWIKRKRYRKKPKYRGFERNRRRRVIMVDDVKRKIRTPIKEEIEDVASPTHYRRISSNYRHQQTRSPSPPPPPPPSQSQSHTKHSDKKTNLLRRLKNEIKIESPKSIKSSKKSALRKEILMEITDSLDDEQDDVRQHDDHIRIRKSLVKDKKYIQKSTPKKETIKYYEDSDGDSDNEIVIRRNVYSGDSLEELSDSYDYEDNDEDIDIIYSKSRATKNKIFGRKKSLDDSRYYYEYYKDEEHRKPHRQHHHYQHQPRHSSHYYDHRIDTNDPEYDDHSLERRRRKHSPDYHRDKRRSKSHQYHQHESSEEREKLPSRKEDINIESPPEQRLRKDTASEPSSTQLTRPSQKGPAPKPPTTTTQLTKQSSVAAAKTKSETDLTSHKLSDETIHDLSKTVPKYMEWYYNKGGGKDVVDADRKRVENLKNEKERNKVSNKKMVGAIEKRIKSKAPRIDAKTDEFTKTKPEPLPRTTPVKAVDRTGGAAGGGGGSTTGGGGGQQMLKEDLQKNKILAPKIETDSNHPLLQYSEHRYEHEYDPAPDLPLPPTKLSHYMYPETPPLPSTTTTITIGDGTSNQQQLKQQKMLKNSKPKPSPIHENEIKETKSSTKKSKEQSTNITGSDQSTATTKQLNASTLEDDHDSGIAMNSLLHNMGGVNKRKQRITDKKSVFSIAYDDVKVNKIQSESDSPQFS